jgi:hypothetical protein
MTEEVAETTDGRTTDQEDKQNSNEPESDSKDDRPPSQIKPVKEKIGEDRDNLRQREDWYQRRTGNSS